MTTDPNTDNFDMTPSQMNKTLERIYTRSEDIWTDWINLGRAIKEKRELAYKRAGDKRSGKDYVLQLKKVMGAFHPNYAKLAKMGTVSSLDSCIENYDAVEAFRVKGGEVGERLTSPRRVWDAYQAYLGEKLRSNIDDRVIKSHDPAAPPPADEDPFVKKPKSAGKRSNSGVRADMMQEFRIIADSIVPAVADMQDARQALQDPEEFVHVTYARLLLHLRDSAKIAHLLRLYALAMSEFAADLEMGRSLPKTLDLGAADYTASP